LKIQEAYALIMQAIKVWSLNDRIAMTRNIAIALIVGKDKDDIGATCPMSRGEKRRAQRR
jgi:hypothetical protein